MLGSPGAFSGGSSGRGAGGSSLSWTAHGSAAGCLAYRLNKFIGTAVLATLRLNPTLEVARVTRRSRQRLAESSRRYAHRFVRAYRLRTRLVPENGRTLEHRLAQMTPEQRRARLLELQAKEAQVIEGEATEVEDSVSR
jgi:hypothetical protein